MYCIWFDLLKRQTNETNPKRQYPPYLWPRSCEVTDMGDIVFWGSKFASAIALNFNHFVSCKIQEGNVY
ncbi:hypothetical protein EUBHAL_02942 [Anaerobutyricum hallii DSM 3353]|uniref:Uncharacterized protein n=1 Tax=Anaerobutyricum hallii DSM 3353 TaxID=411469 RepID=C0EZT1_9FIRM|nr:hypothetical protein EUBHAL_02942 [Anaerobutyricum hallii DSM 3353]